MFGFGFWDNQGLLLVLHSRITYGSAWDYMGYQRYNQIHCSKQMSYLVYYYSGPKSKTLSTTRYGPNISSLPSDLLSLNIYILSFHNPFCPSC